jgi:uncharacterized membrane protein
MWARALRLLGIIAASVFLGYLIGNMQPDTEVCYGQSVECPFVLSGLSIQPQEARPDEAVTISVTVTNRYQKRGIYDLVLQINGDKEDEAQVDVDAGDSQDISFTVTRNDTGSYQVFLNGLISSFEVKKTTY